ncbi:hypothetical protein [Enterovibrio norvegicus]|uniref:hypothetical protein n=1 Tax=Enterovibrio norvegicus TaxID=188144 RepID=UPI003552F772
MKIETTDLLKIIDILKDNLLEKFPTSIDVDLEDFYWELPEEGLYDPTNEPKVLTLGQLNDDWSELLRLKDQDNIPISYDLRRLSVILQIIRAKSVGTW